MADWKAHKDKMGYDDLVDENNKLIVTVHVMDIALDDTLHSSYLEKGADIPKRLYILDDDDAWSIYLNVQWLTPTNIQEVLNEFGRLVGKEFTFKPYILPQNIKMRMEKKAIQWKKEAEEAMTPKEMERSRKFMEQMKKDAEVYDAGPKVIKKISDKRLLEIITHKLKF